MWQKTIKLPQAFVFKDENLKTTIGMLVRLSKLWRKEIHIDFSCVEQVRKGDLMVLFAQLEKLALKNKQIKFKNIPKNVLELFNEKVTHFKSTGFKDANVAKENNPVIIENVVKELKKVGISKNFIYGFMFYERIEALLSEIMRNSVEHGIRNRNINFWLTSETDQKNKQIVFTFVDMGKGIAYSHKKAGISLKYRITGWFSDNKIVLDSLFGKLPSSTQEPNRGKGLPEIRTKLLKKRCCLNLF